MLIDIQRKQKLITINTWDKWVEGSYLLSDMLHGFDYFEAVKDDLLMKNMIGIT